MNGQYLAQGMTSATGDELRLIYALVCETKLLNLMMAKTKDFFNKDIDHFEESLNADIKRLRKRSDAELQLELFLHIQKQLKLPGGYYNTKKDFEVACELIVKETHQLQLKKDKEYREFIRTQPLHELEAMQLVKFQMQKIFESVDTTIQDLDEAQSERFIDQIEHYLQSLPLDKQKEIKQKLNIDDFTSRTLRNIMLTQGSAVMMTIIVEVMGFTAFTTLTSSVAALTGFFGITLSFGSYVFLTSALSVLTGPIGLIVIAAGGGAMLKMQNDKVSKMFIPIGVVQLLLPIMMEEPENRNYTPFMDEWTTKYEEQKQLLRKIADNKQQIEKYEETIASYREKRRELNKKKLEKDVHLLSQYEEMQPQLILLTAKEKSSRYYKLSEKMEKLLEDKALAERDIELNNLNTGFFSSIKNVFVNTTIKSKITDYEAEYEHLAKKRLEEVVAMEPDSLKPYWTAIQETQQQMNQLDKEIKKWCVSIAKIEVDVTDLKNEMRDAEDELKAHQKRWYGLKDIK